MKRSLFKALSYTLALALFVGTATISCSPSEEKKATTACKGDCSQKECSDKCSKKCGKSADKKSKCKEVNCADKSASSSTPDDKTKTANAAECGNGCLAKGVECKASKQSETSTSIKGQLNADGDFVYSLGKTIDFQLPNNSTIKASENGFESKLIAFLNSEETISKDKWFTMEQLYFDVGKATIKSSSQAQITNLVKILKAYPNVVLKLGGYTDNTGDEKANITLSQKRAQTAALEIARKGQFPPLRIQHEGYGSAHPICPENDTEECKAQNRRIDVSIRAK